MIAQSFFEEVEHLPHLEKFCPALNIYVRICMCIYSIQYVMSYFMNSKAA